MDQTTGILLFACDIGAGWGREPIDELARRLETRLGQPVAVVGDWEGADDKLAGSSLINSAIDRIVVLPLGLLTEPSRRRLAQLLAETVAQGPGLRVHLAASLTWLDWTDWLRATATDAMAGLAMRRDAAAVLLVDETGPREANADLARLAHLLLEASPFARVGYAVQGGGRPSVRNSLCDLSRARARQVVVLPWLMGNYARLQCLRDDVVAAAHEFGLSASLSTPALSHPDLVNLLLSRHAAALTDLPVALRPVAEPHAAADEGAVDRPDPPPVSPADLLGLRALERRINALLPPEYKGRYEVVRPKSMGTAKLKFDGEGKVAWNEIWTSFCDLALAGGPPHRGKLLEAVTAEEALSAPEAYQSVVNEIERGIGLVTGLPVVASRTPGWVGIRCESEEMAVWLMRAIIVENVMVHREGEVIYLPAGPRFTIEREIKNVITTIAKTVHYWTSHLTTRRSGGKP